MCQRLPREIPRPRIRVRETPRQQAKCKQMPQSLPSITDNTRFQCCPRGIFMDLFGWYCDKNLMSSHTKIRNTTYWFNHLENLRKVSWSWGWKRFISARSFCRHFVEESSCFTYTYSIHLHLGLMGIVITGLRLWVPIPYPDNFRWLSNLFLNWFTFLAILSHVMV